MSGRIVPKKMAKGVDFCAVRHFYYIVRSDLGCYMRSTSFHYGEDLEVFSLHPACRDGDHYLADKNDLFYIIKGNYYRRVSNMHQDTESATYTLHPNCRGGDFYLSSGDSFYIIYQSQGIYRETKNMSTGEDSVEYPLHPDCSNGLYYFGNHEFYYCVKPQDIWGIQYQRSTNIHNNSNSQTFSIHPSIIPFLPGGIGVSKGPAYGEWVCIKTISNDSKTPIQWQKKVTKKSGYEKEKMCTIEHNWSVSSTISAETGGLSKLICQSQFSLTTEYGGSSVNTERENWNEATEMEELLNITLQPNQIIYIWAYQLCLGNNPVLYCRDIKVLDNSNPPTEVPLPPAAN
ncbi:hypothetical protein GDO81_022297 [Engystomops pustulosus]|uniref:Uncharacterized protein n=1 Tax=Engystomops pustulosus TaxID=76066 RepID=A0AAV6ZAY5_ENGPU|nr:hypothetical protein GDO81_022297 [Engystomops pustulosus]